MSKTTWGNDLIQFARLLSEINSNWDYTATQLDQLCDAMDLQRDDVDDIFDRADSVWNNAKQHHQPSGGQQ